MKWRGFPLCPDLSVSRLGDILHIYLNNHNHLPPRHEKTILDNLASLLIPRNQ